MLSGNLCGILPTGMTTKRSDTATTIVVSTHIITWIKVLKSIKQRYSSNEWNMLPWNFQLYRRSSQGRKAQKRLQLKKHCWLCPSLRRSFPTISCGWWWTRIAILCLYDGQRKELFILYPLNKNGTTLPTCKKDKSQNFHWDQLAMLQVVNEQSQSFPLHLSCSRFSSRVVVEIIFVHVAVSSGKTAI